MRPFLLPAIVSAVVVQRGSSTIIRSELVESADADLTVSNHANATMWPFDNYYVSSVLGVYSFVKNIVNIRTHFADIGTIERTVLAGDVMKDLDTLYTLHDVLKKKLVFRSTTYNCDDCDDAELDRTYSFNRLTKLGRKFENANDHQCVLQLKRAMADIRAGAAELEQAAWAEVSILSKISEIPDDIKIHVSAFGQKSTGEVVAWLSESGFGTYAKTVKRLEFNGLVLAAVTRSKLKQYLGMKTLAEAGALQCKIHAAVVEEPLSSCTSSRALAAYESAGVSNVDPYIFFGVKSIIGGLYAPQWWLSAVARGIAKYTPAATGANHTKKFQPSTTTDTVMQYTNKFLDFWYTKDHAMLVGRTAATAATAEDPMEAFNPIAIAGAVSYLLQQSLDGYMWDDCNKIADKLMHENLWDKLKEFGEVEFPEVEEID